MVLRMVLLVLLVELIQIVSLIKNHQVMLLVLLQRVVKKNLLVVWAVLQRLFHLLEQL
jgi:hypothetical protein